MIHRMQLICGELRGQSKVIDEDIHCSLVVVLAAKVEMLLLECVSSA